MNRNRGTAFWYALICMAALSSCRSSCSIADPPRVLTPEDVARLRGVGDVRISPDGQQIAYVLEVPRRVGKDKDGSAWTELHLVDAAGRSRPFVTGHVKIGHIRFTPDGSGISYLAKRGEDKHTSLYVIPVDGGESRRALTHESNISDYAFSPDGEEVAFLAKKKEPAKKKKLEDKGFKQEIYEEGLEPTRVYIGAPTYDDPDPAKPRVLDLEGSASSVKWSPAGGRLVVALSPTPLIDDAYMKRKLHVVDVATGKSLGRVDTPGKLGQYAFSPDGEHLAVISAADLNDPREGRLKVAATSALDPKTGLIPTRDLIGEFRGHVLGAAWRDDRTLVYVAAEGAESTLGEITVDGGERRVLVKAAGKVLHRVALSKDGKTAALLGDSPSHPREVLRLGERDKEPRRLTDSNPWLKDITLGEQEVIAWRARDGLDIEGVLIHPVGVPEGTRTPLIQVIHGGPESHVHNGWITTYSRVGQIAAGRGFAVLYPNYRGSTGRGVAYSKMDQADYAGKEFDDLVDAITHLDKIGLVDPKKVGITGGSYGGYASAWGATKLTEHFAASVMFVGISDQISKVGTTDIANEMYEVHARRWPWNHWDWFRERSPIFHVEQARTPILILHGKADPRVHPSQSMELYRYLKLIGKTPVRLVLYPGEGHGNRRAAARYDYTLRAMRWMEHYLQGPGGEPPEHEVDYGLDLDKGDKTAKASGATKG